MNDIMEHGVNTFVQHIISQDKVIACKEEIVLVTSQLISFKGFSEKLNLLIRELYKLNYIDNEKELMLNVSKNFKNIFSSSRIHLWLVDSVYLILSLIKRMKNIIF